VLLLASCGDDDLDLPAVEVGRSTHFRYYARAADRVPVSILDLLEAHWTETSTFFRLDQNLLVDYYLFDSADDLAAHGPCGSAGGCAGFAAFTARPFHEHELLHTYFAPLGSTPPLIAEGVASGVSCLEFSTSPGSPPQDASWQAAASNVHLEGEDFGQSRLIRYLIRQHGPEAFVNFYRSAEHTLDPALFALQFDRFWGESIDAVWAAATTPQVVPTYLDVAMCSCSGAEMPVDGSPSAISPLYGAYSMPRPFTLTADSDVVVSMDGLGGTAIRQCWDEDYQQRILRSDVVAPPSKAILHLPAGHYYLQALPLDATPGSISIERGTWLGADCTATDAVSVEAGFMGTLEADGPGAPSFLRLSVAGPRTAAVSATFSALSLCPACDSLPPDCATVAPGAPATVVLDGPHIIKLNARGRGSLSFQ
jgi:hypothetical protein